MKIEGQYLTYQEYKNLGGSLELTPFNIAEFKARTEIDGRTYGRLKRLPNQVNEVKMCIYELIPLVKSNETDVSSNSNISSENIDGYSVTYKSKTIDDEKIKNEEIKGVITKWLDECKLSDGTPYLYRG